MNIQDIKQRMHELEIKCINNGVSIKELREFAFLRQALRKLDKNAR